MFGMRTKKTFGKKWGVQNAQFKSRNGNCIELQVQYIKQIAFPQRDANVHKFCHDKQISACFL